MPSEAIVIQGLIELHMKGEGGEQAVASMTKIIEQAKQVVAVTGGAGEGFKKASEGVNIFAQSILNLGKTTAAFFAASQLKAFLQDSYLGFAKIERQVLAVENQLRSLGQGLQASEFRGFIKELSDTSGILDDDLIPAFQRAIGAFKDYNASTEVVTLASKFAAAGIGDVGSNVEAISRFFQTGRSRGLAQFGIDVREGADGVLDLNEGLRLLNEQANQVGGNFSDAQRGVEMFNKFVDDAKDSVGELLFKMTQVGKEAATGFLANVPDALLGRFASLGILTKTLVDNADAIEQARVDAFFNSESEIEAATRLFADRQAKLDEEANKEKAEKAAEAERDRLEKVATLEEKAAMDLLKMQIEAAQEGSDARFALELQLNNMVYDAAVKNAAKINASVKDLNAQRALEAKRILDQPSVDEDKGVLGPGNKAGIAQAEKELAAFKELEEKKTEIAEKEANTRMDIDYAASIWNIQQAENRKLTAIQSAATIAGVLGSTFQKNKAFAIAMAIANTALGITEVWTDKSIQPWYAKVAATLVVAASGAAQIAAIRSANIGGGGAAPVGGIAAAPTSAAQAPGSQIASQTPTTLDSLAGKSSAVVASGTVINIKYAFGDRQAMTKLTREINKVNANNQSNIR